MFINYRGQDSSAYGAMLYMELRRNLGRDRVFLDCETIPAGADFAAELLAQVRSAQVVLAVIGPHWLSAADSAGRRRIDDPRDWIRRELAEAFAAGVRVIPVLTDQAPLPAAADLPADIVALSRCQFRRLRHREPEADLARIVNDLAGWGIGRDEPDGDLLADDRLACRLTVFPATGRQAPPTSGGPSAQPSYLLDARYAIVGFTGREGEVRELEQWRDSGHTRAVRWLHGPGGQGKTRLAGHVAALATRHDWKVVTVEQATPPESGNGHLHVESAAGLLLLVDYADRWPLDHLAWLVDNPGLDNGVPVRVLLLARTENVFSSLRHTLTQAGWPAEAITVGQLGPLLSARDARARMFAAARDSFARIYGMPDPQSVPVPDGLDRDEFGLTLAVHMAALVAVDRRARTASAPPLEDMTGLTTYLLGRERHLWERLHRAGSGEAATGARIPFSTDPPMLRRAVFTAVLTGPLGYREAKAALDTVGIGADADRVLIDHTFCYPSGDSRTVLEPLYPDRLAEDFLALCVPGHHVPGQDSDAWAHGVPEVLLTPPTEDAPLPPYTARAITFLTNASERWPHLIDTLAGLERLLPEDPTDATGDFVVAAADLTDRLARHRLAEVTEPAARAELHHGLGRWLSRAQREEQAAAALTEARRLYRLLAEADPQTFEPKLAEAALELAMVLILGLGLVPPTNEMAAWQRFFSGEAMRPTLARPDEALATLREAVEVCRRLARRDPAEYEKGLALALFVTALCGPHLGLVEDSRDFGRESVEIVRRLVEKDPGEHSIDMIVTLMIFAGTLVAVDPEHATALADEAVASLRELARDDPAEHEEGLHAVLAAQAGMLLRLGRARPALTAIDEAARILRRRAGQGEPDRTPWGVTFGLAIGFLWLQGASHDTAAGLAAALEVLRQKVRDDPTARGTVLYSFFTLEYILRRFDRWEDVLAGQRDAISMLRSSDDLLRQEYLLGFLCNHSSILLMLGRSDEALDAIGELAEELHSTGVGDLEACLGEALTVVVTDPDEQTSAYERVANDEAVNGLARIAAAYREREPGQGLAVTLKMLTEALWIMGRADQAMTAGAEAIEVRRLLAGSGSAEQHGRLALALRSQAEKAGHHGLPEAREAVALYRRLAQDHPTKYESVLADALDLLADLESEAG